MAKTTEVAATETPVTPVPTGKVRISVTNGIDARFRAGMKFTKTPVELDAGTFTAQQLVDLKADKHLKVEEIA